MNDFHREHREHIQEIFERKTGVKLRPERRRRPVRAAALAAALLLLCLTATAVGASLFSGLEGDDLSLGAVYEGGGVVTIQVENRSDKVLEFQRQLKLMRWSTGEEVPSLGGEVAFEGVKIAPHASGTMTLDLNGAYDLELLEEPLTEDWYYFVLTNHNFAFGQDWMCGIEFAPQVAAADPEPLPAPEADPAAVQAALEELRPYFEHVTFDLEERRTMDAEYMERVNRLLADFEGEVVPSVPSRLLVGDPDPAAVFDSTVPQEEQYLLIGEHRHFTDWNFKLLATDTESALVLSAMLPLERYEDAGRDMPVFYLFTYEKEAAQADRYAFLYGQLYSFAELEPRKVYEDEQHVCYEVSGLIYSDLREHTQRFLDQNPDIRFDNQVWNRVQAIRDYYQAHMSDLFYYQ